MVVMTQKLLEGKRGIIFGALNDTSIAWQVALACHEAGARFVLSNTALALRMGSIQQLAKTCQAELIPADITQNAELEALADQSANALGGNIDFVLHSVGMSPNVRKGRSYGDLNHEWFHKTLDVSALSLHRVLLALDKKDVLAEWGSVVALSYVAAQRTFAGYSDMAEAKCVLESIARSYGLFLGEKRKVRVNTVSQSPTKTTAGMGVPGFDRLYDYAEELSPLGNATGRECGDLCVFLFSDLSRKITMQNLMHDGGFSSVGMTDGVLEKLYPSA